MKPASSSCWRIAVVTRARVMKRRAAPRLGVGEQVDFAASLPGLGVVQAVAAVGGRAQRLRQQREVADLERELSASSGEHAAVRAHDVAEIQQPEATVGIGPEHVCPGVELKRSSAVLDVQERCAPVLAARGQPAGDPLMIPGGSSEHVGDRRHTRERVGEWIDAGPSRDVELGASVGDDAGRTAGGGSGALASHQ